MKKKQDDFKIAPPADREVQRYIEIVEMFERAERLEEESQALSFEEMSNIYSLNIPKDSVVFINQCFPGGSRGERVIFGEIHQEHYIDMPVLSCCYHPSLNEYEVDVDLLGDGFRYYIAPPES